MVDRAIISALSVRRFVRKDWVIIFAPLKIKNAAPDTWTTESKSYDRSSAGITRIRFRVKRSIHLSLSRNWCSTPSFISEPSLAKFSPFVNLNRPIFSAELLFLPEKFHFLNYFCRKSAKILRFSLIFAGITAKIRIRKYPDFILHRILHFVSCPVCQRTGGIKITRRLL